jgi:hypothetical protein
VTVSADGIFWIDFVPLLENAWRASGYVPRTGRIVAGKEVYDKLLRSEDDGPHTTLGGVGWVELALDETMDPWEARIDARQKVSDADAP